MKPQIKTEDDGSLTISVNFIASGSCLDKEEALALALNVLGLSATSEILRSFDVAANEIEVGEEKYSSKGEKKKEYQCPYGKVAIFRKVFQSNRGGCTYVPLEIKSEMIGDNTLRLAKILSWKYAHMTGGDVVKDLKMNHLVDYSKSFIQDSVQAVGEFFSEREHDWEYDLPENLGLVAHIGISRDGAMMPVCPSGWREGMCGSISLYDEEGKRLHTIYKACAPEYGTETFQSLMDSEVASVKKMYPNCDYIGIADGAKVNWKCLSSYTDIHILDFFHASEYVNDAAKILFSSDKVGQTVWAKKTCHTLKHSPKGAKKILKELKKTKKKLSCEKQKTELQVIITYFSNHLAQMDYATFQEKGYPIGSGIIEAACKRLVKQRFSGSGMKWNITRADALLLIRGLVLTEGRWEQAWNHFRKNTA
jgi:hypothetical protein